MTWTDRLETVLRDLRLAGRALRRTPLFTLAVVATLGLGIGANTAIFSFVRAALLRPLPYPRDAELMALRTALPAFGPEATSVPDFTDWKTQNTTFASMTAAANAADNLTADGSDPERIRFARVLGDFFPTFGVTPALGRSFGADDFRAGADHVVILSDALWRRRFSANAGILDKTIMLGGVPYTVIGVAPPGFAVPLLAELWAPLAFSAARPMPPRRADFLQVIGRLKPGATIENARADMNTIATRLATTYPASNHNVGVGIQSLRESIVGDVRPALLMLTVAVGLVLLIACANIANLLLARATARAREMAVRTALGASRARLAMQVLVESGLLSVLGGIVGVLVAWFGVAALKATAPSSTPMLDTVRIDSSVLLFTLLLTMATGIAFGLAPALRAGRSGGGVSRPYNLAGVGDSARSGRLRRGLVVVQAALALALLSGAALFVQSFIRLQRVDLGFNPSGVLTMRVALPPARYRGPAVTAAFFRQLHEQVAALPGVQSVGMSTDIPLGPGFNYLSLGIVGHPPPGPNEHPPDAIPSSADTNYFAAMGTPLLRGRLFGTADDSIAPPVALVNEEFVRRYLPGENPLGVRVSFGGGDGEGAMTIVGVVKTTRLDGVARPPYPQLFRPLAQAPDNAVYLAVRARGNLLALVPLIRHAVLTLDPLQPISDVHTMDERVSDSIGQSRLDTVLLSGLSALALIIAGLGIYGVVAYGVARRTREIGVRMALGATQSDVVALVTRQGMQPVIVGIVVGVGVSVVLGRVARTLLYGSDGIDPLLFAGATLLFVVIATVACRYPATRAARVHPSVALRAE